MGLDRHGVGPLLASLAKQVRADHDAKKDRYAGVHAPSAQRPETRSSLSKDQLDVGPLITAGSAR